MTPLPITYVIYLTTEGYHGCWTIYKATLDHTSRQLPLSSFRHRLASIKITPGQEAIAAQMTEDLKNRGFEVITATAPWERGMSHFAEYIKDMIRVSQHSAVTSTPFIFTTDHDYPILSHKDPLIAVIGRMTDLLESNPDHLSFRFPREGENQSHLLLETEQDKDLFWSIDWNLQPMIMRSRDYFLACKILEDNWSLVSKMHGEALWREILAPFSRSTRKHAVWLPQYAEVANLGCDDYVNVAKRLGLERSL